MDENKLINNIGGYVIKVGDAFVSTYGRKSFMSLSKDYPGKLVPKLSDVEETLFSKGRAEEIAKTVNGQIYQICAEPAESEDD